MPFARKPTVGSAVLAVLLTACGAASAAGGARSAPRAVDAADARAFGQSSNALGLDLWGQLRSEHPGNLAISPASIATALAMTYGGARGNTAAEMADAMHLTSTGGSTPGALHAAGGLLRSWNDPSRTDYELAVANRLYGERTYRFAPPFLAITRDEFGAELEPVDFLHAFEPARAGIDRWVSDMTHARIPEILAAGSVDGDTRLVLVNAVYFHGQWAVPFDREATFAAPFRTGAGASVSVPSVSVPTMHRTGGLYGEADGVQLYRLPYAGGEVSMLFVLPRDPEGLPALEASASAEVVDGWLSGLTEQPEVQVSLPRFQIETDVISLRRPLEALGMTEAFAPTADFSGMSLPGELPLYVSDVFHRVFVELNEEGTEAAAATAVVMTTEDAMSAPPRFNADHPFLFFLRDDRTGALLFLGRVTDPS